MSIEAMRYALAALEWNLPVIEDYGHKEQLNRQRKAITAIKQALKQPVQEPVAWCTKSDLENMAKGFSQDVPARSMRVPQLYPEGNTVLLYTTPQEAQPAPVQEPVAFEVGLVEWVGNKLMATPKTTIAAPASWVEMVTANLVREGVNKHKARELAEHFYWFAQRPFVGLTDEEISDIAINNPPMVHEFARAIEAKLKEKNSDR